MIEFIMYILIFAIGYGFYVGRKEEIDELANKMQELIDRLFS